MEEYISLYSPDDLIPLIDSIETYHDNINKLLELLEQLVGINHLILSFLVSMVILIIIYSVLKKFFY